MLRCSYMQHTIPGPLPDHARNIMRRLGYGEQQKSDGQISYVRRISSAAFPRYHAYVEDLKGGGMQVNLHVDQKEATYKGSHAHSGEYDGSLVEREMQHLLSFVKSLDQSTQSPSPPPVTPSKKKSGFLSKFF